MRNHLIQYVKKPSGVKKAVMFARKEGNIVSFGYSLCSKRDTFKKDFGLHVASRRADKQEIDIPTSMGQNFKDFVNRAKRYFKDCKFNQIVLVDDVDILS